MRMRLLLLLTLLFCLPALSLAAGETRPMARMLVVRTPDARALAGPAEVQVNTAGTLNLRQAAAEVDRAAAIANAAPEAQTETAAPDTASTTLKTALPATPRTRTEAAAAGIYNPDTPAYRIRTGDVLTLAIPYEPDTEKTVPVRPDGRINYLFDIEVMAAGLTYRELNEALRAELARYYKNPRVTVIGQSFEGNSVFIMGPVSKPGRYTIHNDTRLLDVLAVAGAMSLVPTGYSLNADDERHRGLVDLSAAYIARGDRVLDVDFEALLRQQDLSQNVLLAPKDFIYLPSTYASEQKIFILGEVHDPQLYYFTGSITFLEAITQAEGVRDGAAWARRCFIIRGSLKEPKELIRVNYPAILSGRLPDVPLQAGDVVYVPKTPLFKTAEVVSSVLAPLRAISELDSTMKNEFTEGHRQYKHIITKSRTLGTD